MPTALPARTSSPRLILARRAGRLAYLTAGLAVSLGIGLTSTAPSLGAGPGSSPQHDGALSSAAAAQPVSIGINRWQPSGTSDGSCVQVVAFEVTATDEEAVEDARVDLLSEGVVIGSSQVDAVGESTVSGPCASDNDLRSISVSLVDAADVVLATATSLDRCRRDREELTPVAWEWLVGPEKQRPVWACQLSRATGIRFPSGRAVAGFAGITVIDAHTVKTAGSLEITEGQQPVAPTGRIVLRVDGKQLLSRSATVGRSHNYPIRFRALRPGKHRFVIRYLGDVRWEPLNLVAGTFVVPRR